MGKILVVAEKPSVGRDIANVLGCKIKDEGCLIGEQYVVSWAIGHLVTLSDPEEYDPKYKSWRGSDLPIIPQEMKLKTVTKTKKQFAVLKKWMKDKEIDSLICATDSGREGELIFRYIYDLCKCKKPFQRLWISSMTAEAIKEGFANLKPSTEYDNLYESARCRAEADWLVGMNASRAYTIKYNTLLSIGRVQTPTLAIIVQRHQEISNFKPVPYFEVTADFGHYKGLWLAPDLKETKISSKEEAQEIMDKVSGKPGVVGEVKVEEKKVPPPLLYDLTELQRDGNKSFGFSAKKTLGIAQDLYEKRKYITYPRTDSRYLSHDYVSKLVPTLQKFMNTPYQQWIEPLLQEKLPINKRIVDDTKISDHHAIVPTLSKPNLSILTEDERKIYDLIVKRFIAVFYPYYIYQVASVISKVESERFITKGNITLQRGWKDIYGEDKKPDFDVPVQEGDEIEVKNVTMEEKATQPPKPYTEASLLSAMENAGRFVEDEALKEQLKDGGLGTPATRAAIIERLLNVGYIFRKKKELHPTEKGIKLIQVVPEQMKSPETTGKWEKGLSSISKGNMDPKKFIGSIYRYVHFLIQDSRETTQEVVFPTEEKKSPKKLRKSIGTCNICKKGNILENTKAYYCSEWQSGCKFTLWKSDIEKQGKEPTVQTVQEYLKNDGKFIT